MGSFIYLKNKSERPVDALAVKKGESLTHSLTNNLKSRDASASKKKEIGTPRNLHAKDSNTFLFSCIANEKLPLFSCTATGTKLFSDQFVLIVG